MKKLFKIFLFIILAILSITLISCNNKDDESDGYLGKYVLTKYEVNDQELPIEDFYSYIELKENNIVIFYFSGSSIEGTYNITDDKILITILDDTQEATISDSKIIREQNYDGQKEYFEYTKGANLNTPSHVPSETTSDDKNYLGKYRILHGSITGEYARYAIVPSDLTYELQENGKLVIESEKSTTTGSYSIVENNIHFFAYNENFSGVLIDNRISISQEVDDTKISYILIKETEFNLPESTHPVDNLLGVWYAAAYSVEGSDYISRGMEVSLEFEESGLAIFIIIDNNLKMIEFGTYVFDGTSVTITISNTPQTFKYENGKLNISSADIGSILEAEFVKVE